MAIIYQIYSYVTLENIILQQYAIDGKEIQRTYPTEDYYKGIPISCVPNTTN